MLYQFGSAQHWTLLRSGWTRCLSRLGFCQKRLDPADPRGPFQPMKGTRGQTKLRNEENITYLVTVKAYMKLGQITGNLRPEFILFLEPLSKV